MSDNNDFPAYWDFDRDGLTCAGTFVRVDSGPTSFGQKAILILDVDGTERSVWVTTAALKGQLGDELGRRNTRNFTAGERIEVHRGAEKAVSANDRSYWPFKVNFPDAPTPDAATLLDASPVDLEPEPADFAPDTEDIPF